MNGQNAPLQDANTFHRLYERAHVIIYRYIYGSLGRPVQEVEDLTAETFMRAWKARQRFEGGEEAAVYPGAGAHLATADAGSHSRTA